eukprot:PhF_6_TR6212/c0_g1_i1/m.9357
MGRFNLLIMVGMIAFCLVDSYHQPQRRRRGGGGLSPQPSNVIHKSSLHLHKVFPILKSQLLVPPYVGNCSDPKNALFDYSAVVSQSVTSVATSGGGVVSLEAGCFHFFSPITIPTAVTLQGTSTYVPSHGVTGTTQVPTDGTVFYIHPYTNNGTQPFCTITTDSTVKGIVFFYPAQPRTGAVPVEYPYTISMTGNNAAFTDSELLNSYNGIYAVGSARHYIARIQGQPTNIGIYVDETYDIGRIEDVHWNPWYSADQTYMSHQLTYGRAFVFARSDWEYVFNTFAFGYAIGYHFIQTDSGSCNGNFVGIGADLMYNASVQVDAAQPPGILIVNGEFTAFHTNNWMPSNTPCSQVLTTSANTGPLKFVDTSFWGPTDAVARLEGSGTTTFSSCEFVQWDDQFGKGSPAIVANAGSLIVQGSTFAVAKTQISFGPNFKKGTVTGNMFMGQKKWLNQTGKNVQEAGNAYDD